MLNNSLSNQRIFLLGGVLLLPLLTLLLALTFLPVAAAPALVVAADITVMNNNDNGVGSLRQAIAAATVGNMIDFDLSLAGQTITLTTGELVINQNLTIDGMSLDPAITINGNANGRIFNVTGGNVTLTGLTMTNGRAVGENGGAIHNTGNLTVSYSTISNSSATLAGGGIRHNGGRLIVQKSTVISNTSGTFGGGMRLNSGTAVIENSTFAYNADNGAGGGSIDAGIIFTMTNSTIAHTLSGDGIDITGGSGYLRNNIIAYTVTGSDCTNGGGLVENINNLIEDNTCSPNASGDPMLGPLQDNGGRTMTMGILPGSPALDGGDNGTCPATDQRGIARHDGRDQGVVCEIGAYEGGSMQCNTTNMTAPFTHPYPDQSDVQLSFTQNITDYSADCFYVEEIQANHPDATGNDDGDNLLAGLYWRIATFDGDRFFTPSGSATFTATLAIPHDNLANPSICKYPGSQGGSGWDCFTPTLSTTTFLTLTNITSFSDWAAGNAVGPTAVSLQTFTVNGSPVVWLAALVGLLVLSNLLVQRRKK